MALIQLTERQKRTLVYQFIALIWVVAVGLIIWRFSPKANADAEDRRIRLHSYDQILAAQHALVQREMEVFDEIRSTSFDIYQTYRIYELREKINSLHQPDSPVAIHSEKVSKILTKFLDARQELVSKQRNVVTYGEDLQNCRAGNL
jgi:hypothetical protein